MPTSAPGRTEAGLTLVELLVVLLIVGMTAGLTVLMVPRGQSDLVKAVQTFERDVAGMRDSAVAETAFFALSPIPDGYAILHGGSEGWRPVEQRRWSASLAIEFVQEEGWRLPEHDEAAPFTLPEDDEADADGKPEIVFGPDGNVTPFSAVLRDGAREATVRVGPFGRIGDEARDAE